MTPRGFASICRLAASVALERLTTVVRGVAFWTAALLPLAYVPVLIGEPSGDLVGALLAVHVVALVIGHGYERTASG